MGYLTGLRWKNHIIHTNLHEQNQCIEFLGVPIPIIFPHGELETCEYGNGTPISGVPMKSIHRQMSLRSDSEQKP